MESIETNYEIWIVSSRFTDIIVARGARIAGLYLAGSVIPGMKADRIHCKRGIFLRSKFISTGEVRLSGARIGGNLECIGGYFLAPGARSLLVDRAHIDGSVSLSEGFVSRGCITFSGTRISQYFDCEGASIKGFNGLSLCIENINVSDEFRLRNGFKSHGVIDAQGAQVGILVDDADSWEIRGKNGSHAGHLIDGFTYDRISGPTQAAMRIAWLKKQDTSQLDHRQFAPQPWEQLVKVLRETGHPQEAIKVAIEKQTMMRRAGKVGGASLWARPLTWGGAFKNAAHWVFGACVGYGHRPGRLIAMAVAAWLIFALFFCDGARKGLFVPAHGDAYEFSRKHCPSTANLIAASCLPSGYSRFDPWIYSLDLILPVVKLDQRDAWTPVTESLDHQIEATILRGAKLAEILFGWLASLVLVAVAGNLVKKD